MAAFPRFLFLFASLWWIANGKAVLLQLLKVRIHDEILVETIPSRDKNLSNN